MTDTTERDDATAAIENAIETVAKYFLDADDLVTDAVLILGAQYIDDDGDRIGRVLITPRHFSQPAYITVGLLESARRLMDQAGNNE